MTRLLKKITISTALATMLLTTGLNASGAIAGATEPKIGRAHV